MAWEKDRTRSPTSAVTNTAAWRRARAQVAPTRPQPLPTAGTGLHPHCHASRPHHQRRRRRRTTRPAQPPSGLPVIQRAQGPARSHEETQQLEAAARTPSRIATMSRPSAGSSATGDRRPSPAPARRRQPWHHRPADPPSPQVTAATIAENPPGVPPPSPAGRHLPGRAVAQLLYGSGVFRA